MKQEKFKYIGILFLIIVLLGGLFYWYEIKPNSIKTECSGAAENKVTRTKFYGFGEEAEKARDYEAYYQQCLHEKGL
jgi:hypothetical protein